MELKRSVAKSVSNCLRGLNELRIADAHVSTDKLEKAFILLRINPIPDNPRLAWALCVNKIIAAFESIAASI